MTSFAIDSNDTLLIKLLCDYSLYYFYSIIVYTQQTPVPSSTGFLLESDSFQRAADSDSVLLSCQLCRMIKPGDIQ